MQPPTTRASRLPSTVRRRAIGVGHLACLLGSLVASATVLGSCGPGDAAAGTSVEGTTDSAQRGLVIVPGERSEPLPEGVPDRPDFHSFGEVPDGESAIHTFRMRNVESDPIRILSIAAGCGCTAAEVTARTERGETIVGTEPEGAGDSWLTVPPGAEVDLTLRVDTRDITSKNKDRTMTTRVVTDAEYGRYRTFELHLFVAQDLQVNPKQLKLGEVAVGVGGSGVVDIVPVGDREARPVAVAAHPEGVQVSFTAANVLGVDLWQLQASIDPPLELGMLFGDIVLATEGPDGQPGHELVIPFSAQVVPDLRVEPSRLVLIDRGTDDADLVAQCELSSLRAGERLEVASSELTGEHADRFELVVEPVAPDARGRSHTWSLTLRVRGEWPDEICRGEARLRLARATEAEVVVPWVAHPR